MTLIELIQAFRLKADDVAEPYLWSDNEIKSFINAAYMEAAIRSWYFRSRAVLNTVVDKTDYSVSDSLYIDNVVQDFTNRIIYIENVYSDNYRLSSISNEECIKINSSKGRPTYYNLDYINKIIILPIPIEIVKINLDVIYMPQPLVADSDVPILQLSDHYGLLYWALKLAYEKRDEDTGNSQYVIFYASEFEKYYGYRHTLKVRTRQAKHREVMPQ